VEIHPRGSVREGEVVGSGRVGDAVFKYYGVSGFSGRWNGSKGVRRVGAISLFILSYFLPIAIHVDNSDFVCNPSHNCMRGHVGVAGCVKVSVIQRCRDQSERMISDSSARDLAAWRDCYQSLATILGRRRYPPIRSLPRGDSRRLLISDMDADIMGNVYDYALTHPLCLT
jgi:hypothetical protein